MNRDQKIKAIFVRHPESTGNAKDLVKGDREYPLDEAGKRQSAALATRISRYKPTVVVTSPLSRARHAATAIGKKARIRVVEDRGLLPPDYGTLTGTPRKTGEPKIKDAALNHPDEKLAGGDSFSGWDKKHTAAIRRVQVMMKKGERPAVVEHSRGLRELSHALFGTEVKDPTKGGPQPAGFVTLEGKRKLKLHRSVS